MNEDTRNPLLESPQIPAVLPLPPLYLCDDEAPTGLFVPAPELMAWIRRHFIWGGGDFWNHEHEHLEDANIAAFWTDEPLKRAGVVTVGQAEIVRPKPGWSGARSQWMLSQLFGGEAPDFILTFYAPFWAEVQKKSPATCFALIDHELYHCGVQLTRDGEPRIGFDGRPKWQINPHDVEEHVGVVRRWGQRACAGKTMQFVAAAQKAPQFDYEDIEPFLCATCTH